MSKQNKHLLAIGLIFFVFAYGFLGIYDADVLFNMQFNGFYCTDTYFVERNNSIFTAWDLCARYLSQFFYYPEFATIGLCAALSAAGVLAARRFRFPLRYTAFAFVPSLLAVASIGVVGDAMFGINPDLITSLPMGMLMVALLVALVAPIGDVIGYGVALVVGAIVSQMAGIYGLVFMASYFAVKVLRSDRKWMIPGFAVTAILIWAVISLINSDRCWQAPLAHSQSIRVLVWQLAALASMPLTYALCAYKEQGEITKKMIGIICGAMAAVMATVVIVSDRDENLRAICSMERKMVDYDFKGMERAANKVEQASLATYGLRLISLAQQDKLAAKMFDYTTYILDESLPHLPHYSQMYLYAGLPADALRTGLDYSLARSENYLAMRSMIESYILLNEPKAALKLMDKMEQSVVYRPWTKKLRKTIDSPKALLKAFPAYRNALKGLFVEDAFSFPDPFEYVYDRTGTHSLTNIERALLADLFLKRMDQFARHIMTANLKPNEITKVMYEGICCCAFSGIKEPSLRYPIPMEIGKKANEILAKHKEGATVEEIERKYGRSYFTYFLYAIVYNREQVSKE